MILYEYPFNERVRTYLRLEHLYTRLLQLARRDDAVDHHFALTTLFELLEVAARADLKSDVLKDLERQRQMLAPLRGNPAIAQSVLDEVMDQIDYGHENLAAQAGKAGVSLSDNEWLMSVRSRTNIPGGTCSFDLPAYHAWQYRDSAQRQSDLMGWIGALSPLPESVQLLLRLCRNSGTVQKMAASAGQFQQNLPQGRSFQLLRLHLDPEQGVIPEISGNRLLVAIRFLRISPDQQVEPCTDDVLFHMTLCS